MPEFPNFMVVGGMKCGTTSLYHYFKNHPEICAPCKESYLFTPRLNQETESFAKRYSENEYFQLFAQTVTERTLVAGEVSSIYLYCHDEVIPEIKRILGDIKIIIVLRNPVDRAYSNYSYFARDMRDKRTFEEAIEEELNGAELQPPLHYVNMGFYSDQVKGFLDNFSQVHVVLFDDLVTKPEKVMEDIYRFLGVDPSLGGKAGEVFNASGTPKCRWIQNLFFRPTPLKMKIREFVIRNLIPEERFARLMESARSRNLKKVPMAEATRTSLLERYRADIEVLERLIGRDLSIWKQSK